MTTPLQILRELAEAAVLLDDTMAPYLAASEKKADPAEVAKLRKQHLLAVKRLRAAVANFKKLPEAVRMLKKRKKPIDWKQVIDGVASATTLLSKATDKKEFIDLANKSSIKPPPFDPSKVIDVQADD